MSGGIVSLPGPAMRWSYAQFFKSELMTAIETCRYLKITQRTLYRYLRSRQIPAFKLGKEWRFVRSDLEQWIRDRTRTSLSL